MTDSAIILKPSTPWIPSVTGKRKYWPLLSRIRRGQPGPGDRDCELIDAIVAMKQRNPKRGCPRIVAQFSLTFGVIIDRDVFRRILAHHYRPGSRRSGPTWLAFLGHVKDSLWSVDLFGGSYYTPMAA